MANPNPLRKSIATAVSCVAILWAVKTVELLFNLDLHAFSVYPRSAAGLIGILTGPLIHGSWQHLAANTLPTVLLATMLIYGYPKSRFWAISGIWLLSGLGVWLFARSSYHLGVSGITHGMFFYLFIGGILRRDKRSAAILMIAFYMYGGMLISIFPGDPGVSFESHLFGALAGGLCAWSFRNWDPKSERSRYVWQRENSAKEDAEEDPIIGDQWKISRDQID